MRKLKFPRHVQSVRPGAPAQSDFLSPTAAPAPDRRRQGKRDMRPRTLDAERAISDEKLYLEQQEFSLPRLPKRPKHLREHDDAIRARQRSREIDRSMRKTLIEITPQESFLDPLPGVIVEAIPERPADSRTREEQVYAARYEAVVRKLSLIRRRFAYTRRDARADVRAALVDRRIWLDTPDALAQFRTDARVGIEYAHLIDSQLPHLLATLPIMPDEQYQLRPHVRALLDLAKFNPTPIAVTRRGAELARQTAIDVIRTIDASVQSLTAESLGHAYLEALSRVRAVVAEFQCLPEDLDREVDEMAAEKLEAAREACQFPQAQVIDTEAYDRRAEAWVAGMADTIVETFWDELSPDERLHARRIADLDQFDFSDGAYTDTASSEGIARMRTLLRQQISAIAAECVAWRVEEGVAAPRLPGTLAEEYAYLTAESAKLL